MTTEDYNTSQKHVFFKAYQQLWQIEDAIKLIKEHSASKSQVSVLGKFTQKHFDSDKELEKVIKNMAAYWKRSLGNDMDFGSFYNPEIGYVFIVGSLTSMFLHKIDGKTLGAMSTGLYGILRGLGAYPFQAETYLKVLNSDDYLLIIRDFDNELELLEDVLKK